MKSIVCFLVLLFIGSQAQTYDYFDYYCASTTCTGAVGQSVAVQLSGIPFGTCLPAVSSACGTNSTTPGAWYDWFNATSGGLTGGVKYAQKVFYGTNCTTGALVSTLNYTCGACTTIPTLTYSIGLRCNITAVSTSGTSSTGTSTTGTSTGGSTGTSTTGTSTSGTSTTGKTSTGTTTTSGTSTTGAYSSTTGTSTSTTGKTSTGTSTTGTSTTGTSTTGSYSSTTGTSTTGTSTSTTGTSTTGTWTSTTGTGYMNVCSFLFLAIIALVHAI